MFKQNFINFLEKTLEKSYEAYDSLKDAVEESYENRSLKPLDEFIDKSLEKNLDNLVDFIDEKYTTLEDNVSLYTPESVKNFTQKAGSLSCKVASAGLDKAIEKGKEKLETFKEIQVYSDEELIATSKKSSTSGTDKFIIKAELRKRYSNYGDEELFSIGKTSKNAIEREVASMILKERGY